MLEPQGIGIFILLSIVGLANAQMEMDRSCDDPSVCQNGATQCLFRPLSPADAATEVNYVCNCSSAEMIGFACEVFGPSHRRDRAEESFQTCYGRNCRTGTFESLNYPNTYIDRWMAIYLLYIPGATRITFTFEGEGGFGIESFKDELYIGTGLTFSQGDFLGADLTMDGREVRFFDNTTLLGNTYPPPFSFSSDTAWFYFLTDKNIEWNGWRISWEADVDVMPPIVVNCPSNIQRTLERGQPQFVSVTWPEPFANDVSLPVTTVSTHTSGANFFIGTTTVTYTFSDRLDNMAFCSFDVTVIEADTMPPIISNCPADISREVELGTMVVTIAWTEPTATDVGEVTLTQRSHMPGDSFTAPDTTTEISTTTVFYIFSDDNLNSATCSFNVAISAVDRIPPTIMGCPENIFDTVEVGPSEIVSVMWIEPTATDISGTETLQSRSHAPGFAFQVGSTTVTYEFVDASGNSAACTFNVFIQRVDTVPPTVINCPSVVTETVELGQPGIVVSWTEPIATDASEPPAVTVVRTRNPGTFFTIGETMVTYTFTDSSSNSAPCTFTVLVQTQDTIPPMITSCPPDQTQTIELGSPPPLIFWTLPTATDNSGMAEIVSESHQIGTTFNIGTTQVTYVFQDPSGNTAICSFNVEVATVDTTPPTITGCPSDITEMVELGTETVAVFWVEPTATDVSGVAQVSTRSHVPGMNFPTNQPTVVTYEFSDNSENVASCIFTIFVIPVDTIPPTCMNNPADILERIELGTPGATVSWIPPTCNDLSGTAAVSERTQTSPSFFGADSTTVVSHTCTDQAGNTGSCSFSIFIQTIDTTPPTVIQGPDPIIRTIELGAGGLIVSWAEPTVTDFSTTQTLISSSHSSGSFFGVGNTLVTYLYGDESGNTVTYTFCVTVQEIDTVPPTISNCPQQVISVTIELGQSTGVAFWSEPTATDQSGTATLSSRSAAPGDDFMIGQSTVVYTYVDASNNMATCVFTVNVATEDTVPPTISGCPNVIMETVELGVTSTLVFFTAPTATDASGVAQVMRSHTPGSVFPVGITTVMYNFTDASGNSDICSFIINVVTVDTTPPVCVGLPENVIEQVELGNQGTVVTWIPPTCTDNGIAMITGRSHNPNTFFMVNPAGTQVTYTCTDEAGLSTDCSFLVRVVTLDTTPPMCESVPNNPSNTVELGTTRVAMVTWTAPTCADLSPTEQTSTHSPGAFFSIGQTTVTYTCTDSAQNSFSCSFTVNVIEVDTRPPTCVNIPQDPFQTVELGTPTATVTWVEPSCSDASGNPIRASSQNPGGLFPVGDTTVTYTCTDSSNNVGTCSITVTVVAEDTLAPAIMACPDAGSVTAVVELGTPETVVFWAEPTATDVSGIATVSLRSHQPGSSFPVGQTDVTYIFTDASGNSGTCSFTVTVTTMDTTPPTISNCPEGPSTVVELGSTTGSVTWLEPTATDLSGVATLSDRTNFPGTQFQVGQTLVTYTFVDANRNMAFCRFTVTVTTEDTTMPVISDCPTIITEVVELGTPGAVVTWTEPTATDISGQVTVSSRTFAPNSFFTVGSQQVQYTFVDASQNEAVCTFTVVVTTRDTTPPTCVNVPLNGVTQVVELGLPGGTATFNTITCEDASEVAFVTQSTHMSGAFFPIGDTTVTYTCTDGSGNSDQCSFTVTITEEDTTPPQCASQPPDVFETVELGLSQTTVSWIPPTCSDLSSTNSFSSQSPGDFFPVGQTEVTFTCIDIAGNTGTCSFIVNVNEVDTTPPVCVGLPTDVSGTAEIGGIPGSMVNWVPPTCSDLSMTTITSTANPGDFFALGTTSVTYTCTDSANNPGSCTFDVTVTQVDTTPPQCTNLPADITRFVELGLPGDESVTWVEPTCTDASNTGRVLVSTVSPPAFFPVGMTTVTYTCTDDASLTTSCSFEVSIQTRDTIPPDTSNCPEDQVVTVELGTQSMRAFWAVPSATDVSGVANIETNTHSPGDLFNVGMTTVMYVFVDSSQNRATCQFIVTVQTEDTVPPTISGCPGVITDTIELGVSGTVIQWIEPTATDISGIVSVTSRSHQPSSFFTVGVTTVMYVFTDINGNAATCNFMVIINEIDTTPPTILNCPADMGVIIELGTPGTSVTWTEPTATDVSDSEMLQTRSHTPSSFFLVGDTVVTYTYVDASGNTANCRFTVTVTPVDTNPPMVVCSPDVQRVVELGTSGVLVTWSEPTATDTSGMVSLVSRSGTPDTFFQVGKTTVTYIFTDSAGNTATCIFCICIDTVDTTPPTISMCPTSDIEATVEFGSPGTTVSWLQPTATDESGTAILQSASNRPNELFPVGRTLVTYEFIDQALNLATCTFFVNILEVDTVPPTCVNVPADVFEVIELGDPGLTVTWVEPTCQDVDTASVTQRSTTSPMFFLADSVTDVTFTCTDRTGNMFMCDFTVTVTTRDTTPPVITSCPSNVNMEIELGLPGTTITWAVPTAFDVSETVNIQTQSHQSGSFFTVGLTTVTYTFVDPSFNTADCIFVVTVTTEDTTPPTISNCPQSDIRQTVELGTANAVVFYQEPTATDLATPLEVTSTCNNGDRYPVDETNCLYIFTDPSGNQATCTFLIIIEAIDTTPPTVVCTEDVTVTLELGTPGTVVSWQEPTATDISGVVMVQSRSHTPGSFFTEEKTTIVYIFEDASDNTVQCSFCVNLVFEDTTPPECVNVPTPIQEIVELGTPGTLITWQEPSCTDESGVAFVSGSTRQPGSFFQVGTTPVTYTCLDGAGLSTMCTFTVTVTEIDRIPPAIECPPDVSIIVEIRDGGSIATWVVPAATDISGMVTVSSPNSPGTFFVTGVTPVTYTAVDSSGNSATCTFNVEVIEVDTMPPIISNCPQSDIRQMVELGTTSAVVFYQEPTATDLAFPVEVTPTCINGDQYPVGETNCVYIFTDPSGNAATCMFLIIIEAIDTTPPTVVCTDDVTVTLELGTPGTVVPWQEPTATDISGVVMVQSRSHTPGSFFTDEETTIVYIFADASGNTVTCSFCVSLVFEDTTPPECINLPTPIQEIIELGTPGTLITWQEPSCTDESGVAFVSGSTRQPGSFFQVGTTPVTYTCLDGAGLSTMCTFTVTVTEVDRIPPAIECPPDVSITVEIRDGGSIATWVVPTATDISGMVTVSSPNSPGTFFVTGVTPVTYTAVDSSGNSATCTFNVEVIEVDSIPPVVTCPQDITRVIEINTGPLAVNFPLPTATDNSLQVPTLIIQSHQTGDFFNVGMTTVSFTYSDMAGNSNSCTITVNVIEEDTMMPVIAGCPASITEETTLEVPTCLATWQEPAVSDNSGIVTLFSQSHQSNTRFNEGTTVVTYTYTDPTGNQASCSFTVTCNPVDRVDPIVVCPDNVREETSLEVPFCTVFWDNPQATDNSGIVNLVSQSHQSGISQFQVGDTTVTYTYVDPSNNDAMCTFTVTCDEVDRVNPTVICPQDISVTIIEGLTGCTVFFNQPTVSDNSGEVPVVILSQDPNSFFPVGTTPVQVTVRDPSGNQAECTFSVTVSEGNPCDPNPCNNGGFCAIDSLTMFTCVCSECFAGRTCDIPVDACVNNMCQNGAACVAADGACDVYTCECPPCYTGEFCEDFRDACENHQCQGGSTCCPDDNCLSYSCQCPPCFDGPFCENGINACENHQCQNSAQCVPDFLGDCSGYTCSCTGCFTGRFCNQPFNPCQPSPCQNNGFCSPDATDCYRFTCQCQGCFTGTQCEIAIPDPCQANPCTNGGSCSRVGTSCSSYTCDCLKGFIGINCELRQTDNSNPCNSFPCENGASCVESGTSYICMCRTGYSGINCAAILSSQPLLQAQAACNNNPCMNGATCVNSFHSLSNNFVYEPQYSCMCSNSFTGTNCQDFINLGLSFCAPTSPCSNGGTCTNAYHSFRNEVDYVCRCQVGFRGKDCESDVGNPCNSSPCQNSGTCIPFTTYFTCTCPNGFSGEFCQIPSDSGPAIVVTGCPNNVNLNAQGATVTATWNEPLAFGGVGQPSLMYQSHSPGDTFTVGKTPVTYVFTDSSLRFAECTFFVIVTSTNRCSPNPCQNGGICLQNGNTLCDCTGTGFTGNTCSQTVGPALTCPQDISVTTAGSSASANWQQPTTGNGIVFISSSHQSGDNFPIGQTTVTYNYFDTNIGQQVSCSFTVTVSAIVPSLTCPADVSETTPGSQAVVTWPAPTTNGNLVFISSTAQSGDSFPLGQTMVTYNYFDPSIGQQIPCSFTVTVTAAPVVLTPCPSDITQLTNQALTSVTWMETNNGGTQFVTTRSHTSGSLFDLGLTQVTLNYFDITVSQTLSCTFNINLIGNGITQPPTDNTPPQFNTCPDDIRFATLPAAAAGQPISIQWMEPTYDNEGGTVQLNQTHSSGDQFTVGQDTNVIYTITDTAGNSATCGFVISLQTTGRRKRDVDFEGLFQRHETEECPCQNGGQCISMQDLGSFCACPADYSGIICEVFKHDDQTYISTSFNGQLLFVIVVGVLVIIICLLALSMLRITRKVYTRERKIPTDEVAIIN